MNAWRLLWPVRSHLPRILLAGLVSAAAELAGIALIATASWLLATAAGQPPLTSLTVAIVGVRAFAIGRGLLRYLDRLVGHDAVLRALARLRAHVFRAVTPLAPGMTRRHGGGDLLTRLVSDVDSIQDLVLRVVTPAWTAGVVALAVTGFTAVFSPAAAAVVAAGLALAGVGLPLLAGRVAGRHAGEVAAHRARLADATVDLVGGAADLAAYGATDAAAERAGRDADRLAAAERRAGVAGAGITAAGTLIAGATVVGVFLTAGGLGVMTAVLALTALVGFEVVAPLPDAARRFVEIRGSADRVVALLDAEPVVPDPPDPAPLPTGEARLTLWDVRPELPGRRSHGAGVTLDLPPGRRIGIVGASGAGKSMLLASLVRFTPVAQGTVTLGGIDLVDLTRLRGDDVRTVIGGMLSDAHVFHTTVRENLLVAAPEAEDEALTAALRLAGLPDLDLDRPVGEDGGELSGGQRQRLLLARALLGTHRILLLDEPTEHLDDATADAVTADLLAATDGRSVILVTHRLTGLEALDEILVMDDGAVVQRGRHDELVAVDGPYRRLWRAGRLQTVLPGTTEPERTTDNTVKTLRNLAAVAVAAVAVLAFAPGTASAHAGLISSDPEDGARLPEPPAQVVLEFSEEVDAPSTQLALVAPGGDTVPLPDPSVEGDTITQPVTIDTPGTYTFSYRLVSQDGHPVEGSIEFDVASVPTPSGSPSGRSSAPASPQEDTATAATDDDSGGVGWGTVGVIALVVVAVVGAVLGIMTVARRRSR
ncbi:ATP-binding cassette subfamily C protein/ATP-binding cassette subfamily C protein CydC [Stackebrandtia albiflava]|uniref:ATP-binding cassette subfamily C protein/ATP-binding cassette subfamily C protein CydC n=1 Tax=Stackebrandtia albiflava TaxID=406432 RepID=A0A562UZ13_9ACTN|nr:thiol reductant ABC exporter subunit CydC [Stackebrandtia albiflava]TWJ10849.1 ATP-binding cassette subfamily C protein/ATP-binding cassette subfamily C protein CydC [Stackebrandtia albiflava]